MPVTYPLDLSGNAPTNLVEDELHTVSESRFRDYYFIVPMFAPFFVDNFSMSITISGVTTQLVEDVDFSFALEYVTGTRTTGKVMYGGLTLHNLNLNGILKVTYQTVGGDQVADRLQVLQVLADKVYNPRTTIWDVIIDLPNAFPPVPHYQDYDEFYGQEEVVVALGEIRDAILENIDLTSAQIQAFFTLLNNGSLSSYVKRIGDTMSGPLTLVGNPTTNLQAVPKQYVDAITSTINTTLSSLDYRVDVLEGNIGGDGGDLVTKELLAEKLDELRVYLDNRHLRY